MSAQEQSVSGERSILVDHPNNPGGPLKERVYVERENSDHDSDLHLAYCPVCGPEVSFEGQRKPSEHLSKVHGGHPEDFGLEPMRRPVLDPEECVDIHVECKHCEMESRAGFVVPAGDSAQCEENGEHEWVEVSPDG